MSVSNATTASDDDVATLHAMGYGQDLLRRMGGFSRARYVADEFRLDPSSRKRCLVNLDGDAAASKAAMDQKLAGFATQAALRSTGGAPRQ